MNKELQQQVFDALQALAEKLGTSAEYLWSVLLKQAYIEGMWHLAWATFWGVLLIVGISLLVRGCIVLNSNAEVRRLSNRQEVIVAFCFTAGGLSTLVGFIGFSVTSWHALVQLGNPEYWALQQILRQL